MPGLITGTDQNDHLIGTEFSNQIFALGGDDTVRGLGDNDQIYGGAGTDELYGGAGNDEVYGGEGSDFLFYDGGVDSLYGGADDDFFTLTTVQSGLIVDGGAGLTFLDLSFSDLSGLDTKLNVEFREQSNNTFSLIVNGETATVFGEITGVSIVTGSGNDSVVGASTFEFISVGNGDDSVSSNGGDDIIDLGAGDDRVNAGAGDDLIALNGLTSGDHINGGSGFDAMQIYFDGMPDVSVDLRENADGTISMMVNNAMMDVQGVEQVLSVSFAGGRNSFRGTDQQEYVYGGNGDDRIDTAGGDDFVFTGLGDDWVNTGAGDDLILSNGLTSGDHINGGSGFDALEVYFNRMSDVSVDLRENADGTISMMVNHEMMDVQGIEQVLSVSFADGRNSFRGTDQQENVYGGNGDDRFETAGGNDFVFTGFGDDLVNAGAGDDYVYVLDPSRSDAIDGGDGDDTVYLDFSASAGPIDIRVDASRHNPMAITLDGSRLNITNFEAIAIMGSLGDDSIRGGDGDDTIDGFLGDDILLGYAGADVLSGSLGDDTIAGGAGRDTLYGGEGADDFVFARKGSRDTIVDFEVGVDHIVISAGNRVSNFNDLQISQHGDDVWINLRGTSIVLLGVDANDLSADNFIFG